MEKKNNTIRHYLTRWLGTLLLSLCLGHQLQATTMPGRVPLKRQVTGLNNVQTKNASLATLAQKELANMKYLIQHYQDTQDFVRAFNVSSIYDDMVVDPKTGKKRKENPLRDDMIKIANDIMERFGKRSNPTLPLILEVIPLAGMEDEAINKKMLNLFLKPLQKTLDKESLTIPDPNLLLGLAGVMRHLPGRFYNQNTQLLANVCQQYTRKLAENNKLSPKELQTGLTVLEKLLDAWADNKTLQAIKAGIKTPKNMAQDLQTAAQSVVLDKVQDYLGDDPLTTLTHAVSNAKTTYQTAQKAVKENINIDSATSGLQALLDVGKTIGNEGGIPNKKPLIKSLQTMQEKWEDNPHIQYKIAYLLQALARIPGKDDTRPIVTYLQKGLHLLGTIRSVTALITSQGTAFSEYGKLAGHVKAIFTNEELDKQGWYDVARRLQNYLQLDDPSQYKAILQGIKQGIRNVDPKHHTWALHFMLIQAMTTMLQRTQDTYLHTQVIYLIADLFEDTQTFGYDEARRQYTLETLVKLASWDKDNIRPTAQKALIQLRRRHEKKGNNPQKENTLALLQDPSATNEDNNPTQPHNNVNKKSKRSFFRKNKGKKNPQVQSSASSPKKKGAFLQQTKQWMHKSNKKLIDLHVPKNIEAIEIVPYDAEPQQPLPSRKLLVQAQKSNIPIEYHLQQTQQQEAAFQQATGANQDLALYVPVNASYTKQDKVNTFAPLMAAVETFLYHDAATILLLSGDAGSGKSLFGRLLIQQLWQAYHYSHSIVPLFISLPTLKDPTLKAVEQTLNKYDWDADTIQLFKKQCQQRYEAFVQAMHHPSNPSPRMPVTSKGNTPVISSLSSNLKTATSTNFQDDDDEKDDEKDDLSDDEAEKKEAAAKQASNNSVKPDSHLRGGTRSSISLVEGLKAYVHRYQGQARQQPVRLLLFLDGYDEIRTHTNLYQSNELIRWGAKVIISCRTEYLESLGDYYSYFQGYQQSTPTRELYIRPLNDQQIDTYLTHITQRKAAQRTHPEEEVWQQADYHNALNELPSLQPLIRAPFLLQIIVEVLPTLTMQKKKQALQGTISRSNVFEAFLDQWFTREANKMIAQKMDIPDGFRIKPSFWAYAMDVAQFMFAQQRVTIKSPSMSYDLIKVTAKEGAHFFTQDRKNTLARRGAPLKRLGNNVWSFPHKTILEFLTAKAIHAYILFMASDEEATLPATHPWNQRNIYE